jgi:hypothetical protein
MKAQKITARKQVSSKQNSTKLGHSEYEENGLAKGTQKMGNKVGKLQR